MYEIYKKLFKIYTKIGRQGFFNYVFGYHFYDSILLICLNGRDNNINELIEDVINHLLDNNYLCFILLCLIEKYKFTLDEIEEGILLHINSISTWIETNNCLIVQSDH